MEHTITTNGVGMETFYICVYFDLHDEWPVSARELI